jgi:hypothetical protein
MSYNGRFAVLFMFPSLTCVAQEDPLWMRHTEVKCAYFHESKYDQYVGREFLCFMRTTA